MTKKKETHTPEQLAIKPGDWIAVSQDDGRIVIARCDQAPWDLSGTMVLGYEGRSGGYLLTRCLPCEPPTLDATPNPLISQEAARGSLTAAILFVMERVAYAQKTGSMSGGGARYTYASEGDLIGAVRRAMVDAGLMLIPAAITRDVVEHGKSGRGSMQWRTDAVFRWDLLHISGESRPVCSMGSGVDSGDKAAYKAATGALKYALRQVFMLQTGDDPDAVSSKAQEVSAERTREQREAADFQRRADAPHDPEWDKDRVRFITALRQKCAVEYEDLKKWLLSRGGDKPSTMGRRGRHRLITDIESGALKPPRIDVPEDEPPF